MAGCEEGGGADCESQPLGGLPLDLLPSKRKWEAPAGSSSAAERPVPRPCSSATCSVTSCAGWGREAAAAPARPEQRLAQAGLPRGDRTRTSADACAQRTCASSDPRLGFTASASACYVSLVPLSSGDQGEDDGSATSGRGRGSGDQAAACALAPAPSEQLGSLALQAQPPAQWAELPDDILKRVLERLPPSHLRVLRLVCRGWEGATGRLLRTLRPETLPSGLAPLGGRFPGLSSLDLSQCVATVVVRGPRALRMQSLLSDGQLPDLGSLPRLRELSLRGCGALTAAGFARAAAAAGLRELNLAGCPGVTDDVLRALCALSELRTLNLTGCAGVTDAGLGHLLTLPALRHVSAHSGATDAGLGLLSCHAGVERVECRGCAGVTSPGIYSLLSMPRLKRVVIARCPQVTMESLRGAGFSESRCCRLSPLRWVEEAAA